MSLVKTSLDHPQHHGRHSELSVDVNVEVMYLLSKLGCTDATLRSDPNIQAQANEVYTYRRGKSKPALIYAYLLPKAQIHKARYDPNLKLRS